MHVSGLQKTKQMHVYGWCKSLMLRTFAIQYTSLISPVNGRDLHIVTNKHSLLDLLEQSTDTAQEVGTLRTDCRSDIGFVHSDCHKVRFLADDLQAILSVRSRPAAKPGPVSAENTGQSVKTRDFYARL